MIDSKKPTQQATREQNASAPTDATPSAAKTAADMPSEKSNEMQEPANATNTDTREPNPLEMPHYDISRDSKEYKNWRQAQYQHGIRNLLLALVVFGGLALLYWLTLSS